ncbi:hypothetical protein GCM10023336_19840 [Streptomyces similanensis]|uniref:Uncharacterized protein n=1 Tax=Streptomyces similanensis TaxID=1274988 RepID=A0ABP9K7X3_9ACTN
MGWVSAGGYEVALDDGKVVCRNAAGRRLKSVPPKIADDPAVLFSEPVLTSTGYAGAVIWTADAGGRLYTVSDVAQGRTARRHRADPS